MSAMQSGSIIPPDTGGNKLAGLGGVRVLVVEDEYFIAQDLRSSLEAAGASVVGPVGDVAAGMALLKSE